MHRWWLDLAAGLEPGAETAVEHRAAAMPDGVEKPDASRRQRSAEVLDKNDGFATVQTNASGRFPCGVGEARDRFRRGKGQSNLIDIDMRRSWNAAGLVVTERPSVDNHNTWPTEIGAKPGDINDGTRI